MNTVLVTGGLGFIGSNFILNYLESTPESHILNVDSMSYGSNPLNLVSLTNDSRYEFVKCDIRDTEKVTRLISSVETVVNFAAETHVDRSISDPVSFLQSNTIGTFSLLEAARKGNLSKFIQVSTDEVYGSTESTSFTEESELNPSSPYSASKAAADLLALSYHKTYGLPVVILRCTNNFGPLQFLEKFIPKTIILATLNRRIPIYGSGLQVRDWIYVPDFCSAINLALIRGSNGRVYNVSAGNELPNLEVANRILNYMKKPSNLIKRVEDRPAHDARYSLNSQRIREELGWAPSLKFNEALHATVDWYLANEAWWNPLVNDRILSPTPWKENWSQG